MSPLVLLVVFGQKPPQIIGAWAPDLMGYRGPLDKGFKIVFAKGGKLHLRGHGSTGEGTYAVKNDTIKLTLTRRNGFVLPTPSQTQGTMRIEKGGKALLLLGPKGKTLRFVRSQQ